jgi:predicted nucleotidyltransferase
MEIDPRVRRVVAEQPYPLIFATISGAHLYGFPSADSDWDLRGVHVLPARDVLGLDSGPETEQDWAMRDGLEIDLVTHDAKKFFTLMLRRNGYVLEQLLSPLVLLTTPAHAELKAIAPGCITRGHAEHYLGFARNEWKLFTTKKRTVKKLLYLYRVLLTGIHLMRTHEVEANLERLNALYPQPAVPDLIALKRGGQEKAEIGDAALDFHERA